MVSVVALKSDTLRLARDEENMGKFHISPDSYLECSWGDVCLCYTEHSPDHWYSNTEASVYINKDMALKIIEYLKEAYDI